MVFLANSPILHTKRSQLMFFKVLQNKAGVVFAVNTVSFIIFALEKEATNVV
jgi:hypothetical protein